jgi:DNA invertase Pin-like site-specific DNA recombinase
MTPKAVAIYVRISRDRGGQGLGVSRQESDCRAWCEAQGWQVREVFVDNDVSAYSGRRRPAFERMVEGIKAGLFDAIVVWHPDRLTRSAKELDSIIDLVEATGVALGTVTAGDYDLTTPEGRLVARIVGAVARKESEDKSRRIRRKHLELAEKGDGRGGGTRPFGFNADRLTINEPEAELIREAARRILAGESVRGVLRDWGQRGVATVTGAEWSPITFTRMLTRARTAGLRSHHGKVTAKAVWPGILTSDDHVKLVAVLTDPARRKSHQPTRYLLTGFVFCELCGARMVARPTQQRKRRYTCAKGPGYHGCGHTGIDAEGLERLVSEAVIEAIAGPGLAKAMAWTEADAVGDDAAEIAALEARQAELAELWAAGEIGKIEWWAARDALEKRLETTRTRIVAQQAPVALNGLPASAEELTELWDTLSFDRRRAIIGAVVEKLTIRPGHRGYNRFDASRVAFTWKV